MYCVFALGTEMATFAILPKGPLLPVRAIVCILAACAASTARMTFTEPPLVLMPTKTSPGFPSAWTCRANTPSNPTSLA